MISIVYYWYLIGNNDEINFNLCGMAMDPLCGMTGLHFVFFLLHPWASKVWKKSHVLGEVMWLLPTQQHIIIYHHVSSFIIIYHHWSLFIIIYHHLSSFIIIYHHLSLFPPETCQTLGQAKVISRVVHITVF